MNQRNEAYAEVEALTRNIDKLDERLDRLNKMAGSSNSSAAQINVNAGGIAVWVATSACLVTLAVTIVAAVFVSIVLNDQGRQIGRAQDHLTAIYMMAPHLKPKENTDVIDNYYHHPAADQAEAPQRKD